MKKIILSLSLIIFSCTFTSENGSTEKQYLRRHYIKGIVQSPFLIPFLTRSITLEEWVNGKQLINLPKIDLSKKEEKAHWAGIATPYAMIALYFARRFLRR